MHYYTYEEAETIDPLHYYKIIISWDTANKAGMNNAYSACCVVLMTIEREKIKYYLLDVIRGKWEFVDLIPRVIEIYNKYKMKNTTDIRPDFEFTTLGEVKNFIISEKTIKA